MRNRYKISSWRLVLAVGALAAVLTGVLDGTSSAAFTSSARYLVGVALPVTGAKAEAGRDILDGELLAAAQINAAGGILGHRMVLKEEDSACDRQTAISAARRLISEGVQAMAGNYCSDAALAAEPIVARAGIPNLQPDANSPSLTARGFRNVFLLDPSGTRNATTAAAFFARVAHDHRIVIADDRSFFAVEVARLAAREMKRLGLNVMSVQSVSSRTTNFSRVIGAIRNYKASGVYWTGYYAQAALFVKQLRAARIRSTFVVADGSVDPEFIKDGGSAAEGTYATIVATTPFLKGRKPRAFRAAFRKRYHHAPGPYSAYGYDAILVLARAARNAGSLQPAKVIAALHRIKFCGVTGPVSFSKNGSRQGAEFIVLTVKNGRYELAPQQP